MRPGGPQMLRDLQHLMGLPVLKYESERWKIDSGNNAAAGTCQAGIQLPAPVTNSGCAE